MHLLGRCPSSTNTALQATKSSETVSYTVVRKGCPDEDAVMIIITELLIITDQECPG
jgi:hypothetical protein